MIDPGTRHALSSDIGLIRRHSIAQTINVAIMMISSDMEEVLSESDRIAVMHEGRITGILTRADASEETIMKLAVGQTI